MGDYWGYFSFTSKYLNIKKPASWFIFWKHKFYLFINLGVLLFLFFFLQINYLNQILLLNM